MFSTGEWINKLWYTHTMEFYSATERNELLIYIHNIAESQMHGAKFKEARLKMHTIMHPFI